MFFVDSFIIGLFSGLVSGIIVGLIIKFKVKTSQEKIFEKNRNAMLRSMLTSSILSYSRLERIWKVLETLPNFDASKNYFSKQELSDSDYYVIVEHREFVQKLLKNFLSFSECSTYVTFQEYSVIKGYMQSSLFVGLTDGSAVNKKNLIHYFYKYMLDHTFFAKTMIEDYPELLPKYFISDWTKILQNENLFSLTELQKRELGDLVPDYDFQNESVFGRHNF